VFVKIVMATGSAIVILGCGASQQFAALPPGLDRTAVTGQLIEMQAKRYDFVPEVITVKAGTLVTLKITAQDGVHGFALDAFGIDERIEEGETRTIVFYALKPGEYGFHCSHLCGLGHFGMKGKLIVQ
jgi:cytochrome c oxidase subunit II